MDVLVTLFYILFSICVIYPPTEFVSAGFTIPQLFESYLGSENTNFVRYHMKRISLTTVIHSALPLGYVLTLWCGGERGEWMRYFIMVTAFFTLLTAWNVMLCWECVRTNHPVVKALAANLPPEMDWRQLAAIFNTEFRNVEKVSIPLNATSKFIATERWLIKVSQYRIDLVRQSECALIATATDSHSITPSGEDEVQYLNIEAIPSRNTVKRFSFRISTASLQELTPRLERPVRVPDHISVLPTPIEAFVNVFRQLVEQNPVYYVDEELELCIGCMQNTADVKLTKRCQPPPPPPPDEDEEEDAPPCQQCNCRVLWCCACMARWWAARAPGPPARWLARRGSCPVCRAVFCLLDVSPAAPRPS